MAAKGSALKGALAAGPRGRVTSLPVKPRPIPLGKPNAAGQAERAGAGLQRISPGMYRNPQGQLVNSRGGNLPGQRSQQQRPMPSQQANVGNVLAGVAQGANQFQPRQPMQPATRPPMPYGQGQESGMMYTGGTPNFDEIFGQYKSQVMPQRPEMPSMDYQQMATAMAERQAFAQQGINPQQQQFSQMRFGQPQQGMQQNMQQYQQMEQPQQQSMMPQNGFYKGNA